jgi:hypothetical protein
MKKLIAIVLAVALLASFSGCRIYYCQHGDLTGTWLLNVNDGTYMHDMFIETQSWTGALTGTGGYPAGGPYLDGYDWTMTGQLTGDSVTMTITYTNGYTTTLTGTVDLDWNTMSGTGTSGVTTWVATRAP